MKTKKNNKIRTIYVSLVAFLAASILSFSKDYPRLPYGWRIPTDADISEDIWRKKDPYKYLIAKGDFNGDGIIDVARLLIRVDGWGVGLFAFVSQEDHTVKPYALGESNGADSIHRLGIRKVPPGTYKTACGKGYWECGQDEVPEISIVHDAIDCFVYESANEYFFWDTQARAFKEIVISD